MKKNLFIIPIIGLVFTINNSVFAETAFSRAIATCDEYSQSGIIVQQNEAYSINVSLKKGKKDKCIYKEQISIGKNVHTLTCNFNQNQTKDISQSMSEFSQRFKSQMQKNPIFESKLSTNSEIFQKYLVDPQYCVISGNLNQ